MLLTKQTGAFVDTEKAQFLNFNAEKLGFLFWNFPNVVNPHASGTPIGQDSNKSSPLFSTKKTFNLK